MSNDYNPPPRGDNGNGISEAYPSSMVDGSEAPPSHSHYSGDDPDVMRVFSQSLDQSRAGGGGFGRAGSGESGGFAGHRRGSVGSVHSRTSERRGSVCSRSSYSSFQPYYAPGERSVAASSSHVPLDDSNRSRLEDSYRSENSGDLRKSMSRSVYEEAQLRSSRRIGGILYDSAASSGGRSSRHGRSGRHSSFNSGSTLALSSGPTYINPHPQHNPIGVSMSGNLLVRVNIEEEAELELDKDEMRELVNALNSNEATASEARFQPLAGDCSTIATTRSTRSRLSKSSSEVVVSGSPDDTYGVVDGPRSEIDEERTRMKEVIFSPTFRRALFLGICFVLLGLGILLTLENFMSVKTASDWLEPHRDKYLMEHGGGIDWAFGSDAPKPIAGASIDDLVESRLADWHQDTSRVPAAAGMDGFGSVAVSEAAMFKDVPVFWGLPFTGGDILDSVLGQCLSLVQASDKGTQDEDAGDDLHLRTVFVEGKSYLNVDLSNSQGIQRASALALGTSGMADVAHSPLLYEVSRLFSPMNRGRLFILVRHPVEREFARYRHMQRWRKEELLGDDEDMTYDEYAQSEYVADNWMTRTLVGKNDEDELTANDMHTAKEILRRKALVGLYSDIMGAARHYARHFGWDHARGGGRLNKGTISCFERAILDGMRGDLDEAGHLVEKDSREGTIAWGKVMKKNKFDFELYIYSQQLYKFQISLS